MSSSNPAQAPGLKSRLREELVAYVQVSAYLYVCFGAVQLYKAAILGGAGVHYVPLGVALAKALVLGKFILVGGLLGRHASGSMPTLLHRVAVRSLLLLVFLAALTFVEELVVGMLHGHALAATLDELLGARLPEIAASLFLLLLVLIPLVTATELNRALGHVTLWRLLKTAPPAAAAPHGH
ncbi:MAG: hypothetical protein U5L03_08890 [Burkholderiaceae bacterium]|nr:hypothetical protein [Burkholderiaceae bacterium]